MTVSRRYLTVGTVPNNPYPVYTAKGGAILAVVDLSNLFGPIEDQGQLGSCSAFSGLQWFQAYLYKRYGIWIEFAELAQYYAERKIEGTVDQDSGATMVDAVNVLVNTGVILEQEDDYLTLNFKDVPPDQWIPNLKLPKELVKTVTSLNDALDAIGHGYPVLIGFTVFQGLESKDVAQTGMLPMPAPNEQPLGGHGVVAVGKDDIKRLVKCRNQWSPYWGDHGYFYMPYDYFSRYVDEAYIIEFDGDIPANPIPHRYGVEIEFSKTECTVGEQISVYVHTFDGRTPVNTINLGDGLFANSNQIPHISFVYPSGSKDPGGPLSTMDNGRAGLPWGYAGPEEGLVVGRVEWLAPDGNTYTNEAYSVWRKSQPTPAPQPEPKKLYHVQVGAFSVKANADAELAKLKAAGFNGFIKYE